MSQRTFIPWSDDDDSFQLSPKSEIAPEITPSVGARVSEKIVDRATSGTTAVQESRGRSWAFYLFSAALHLLAALALSRSWTHRQPAGPAASTAKSPAAPVVERVPLAKIEIDVAPVKYCDLDMNQILGLQPEMMRLVPPESKADDKKNEATRPRRRRPLGPGAVSEVMPQERPVEVAQVDARQTNEVTQAPTTQTEGVPATPALASLRGYRP